MSFALPKAGRPSTEPAPRKISEFVWHQYDDEIEGLYILRKPAMPLEEMRLHFQHKYGFTATKKQWKDHLSKVGYKRNLDRRAAAVICHLIRDAEVKQIQRLVYYNSELKTQKNIDRYVSKTEGISTCEALLKFLPQDSAEWPKNVTCWDGPEPEPVSYFSGDDSLWSPASATKGIIWGQPATNPATVLLQSQLPHQSIIQANDNDISFPLQNQHAVTPALATYATDTMVSRPLDQSTVDGSFSATSTTAAISAAAVHQQTTQATEEDLQNSDDYEIIPNFQSAGFYALHSPFENISQEFYDAGSILPGFSSLASATPVILPPNTNISALVDQILGPRRDHEGSHGKTFMRQCVAVCMFIGQEEREEANGALRDAVLAFQTIMDGPLSTYTWSLALLNQLSFLLESYGQSGKSQRNVKFVILQTLLNELKFTHEPKWSVLRQTLAFLLDTANWDDAKAQAAVSETLQIYDAAKEHAGWESPLALAAQYNVGWVLLEAKRYAEALSVLNENRARCESTFGTRSLEAITWAATLARALFRSNHTESAIDLMEETVLARTEKLYNTDHPLYWEVQCRVGMFLLLIADSGTRPQESPEKWFRGEQLLRKTLVWRGCNLGRPNPKTTHTFLTLRKYLGKQGKTNEAANLDEWLTTHINERPIFPN